MIVVLEGRGFDNNIDSLASASLVYFEDNVSVYLTAAHAVYDLFKGRFEANIKLTLKERDISFDVVKAYVPKGWVEAKELKYDFAFLVVEADINSSKELTGNVTPPLFGTEDSSNHGVTVQGYENTLFRRSVYRKFSGVANYEYVNETGLIGIHSKNRAGMSGGSWIIETPDGNRQIAVTSATVKGFRNVLWAVVLSKEAQKVFEDSVHKRDSSSSSVVKAFKP